MRCRSAALGIVLSIAQIAFGQSFNVDLDLNTDPELGGGPPSAAFGAAANQPGIWNSIAVNGSSPWLHDLQGVRRNVALSTWTTEGWSGGGYRDLRNTGDFALLLNDSSDLSTWRTWTFHG